MIKWDTSKTGVPTFDESIVNPANKYRHYDFELQWIPTVEFLLWQIRIMRLRKTLAYDYLERRSRFRRRRLRHPDGRGSSAMEMLYDCISRSHVKRLKQAMLAGRPFSAFCLEFDVDGGLVDYQEGRHRAVALRELQVEKVPVYFMRRRLDSK